MESNYIIDQIHMAAILIVCHTQAILANVVDKHKHT